MSLVWRGEKMWECPGLTILGVRGKRELDGVSWGEVSRVEREE